MPRSLWQAVRDGGRRSREYAVRHPVRAGAAVAVLLAVAVAVPVATAVVRASSDASAKRGLVVMMDKDSSFGAQRKVLIEQWNALHGGDDAENNVTIVEVSGVADGAHSEIVANARAGRGDVDVYNLDVTWTAEFVAAEYIRPLDESTLDLDGFLRAPLDTGRYEGKQWALPFNTDAGLLFYRRDLVDPPDGGRGQDPSFTWQDIVREAGSLPATRKRPGGSNLVAGYASQLDDYEGLTVNALEAIWSTGDGVRIDGDGRAVVDPEKWQNGVGRLLTATGPSPEGQVVLPDSRNYDEPETTQAFRDGKVLFMRNWPVAYRTFDAASDIDQSQNTQHQESEGVDAAKIGVAALPGDTVLGGQNLAVAKHSEKPRQAQELIEFLTSPRSQQILFERGGLAATQRIVYHDPTVVEKYPYATTLLRAIEEKARSRPVIPHYARFSEVFRSAVLATLNNGGQLPDNYNLAGRLTAAVQGR